MTRHNEQRDEGMATLFVVFLATAMLAVAGVVIDAGYAMAAKRHCLNLAEQASRVGADALNRGQLRAGVVTVNPDAAVTAAQDYLTGQGEAGTVTVNGGQVTVTVHRDQQTAILSAVGITHLPVSATATSTSIDAGAR